MNAPLLPPIPSGPSRSDAAPAAPLTRRDFSLRLLMAALAAVPAANSATHAAPGAKPTPEPAPAHDMSQAPASWMGKEVIALVVYPQFTALDLIGPQYMFASLMGAKVHLVAKSKDPVKSDTGVVFVPDLAFADCPSELDVLFVPGGTVGTLAAMQDAETIRFLQDRGARARFVTAVCTGSLVLGAAGLLRGYKATSHWMTRPLLRHFGSEAVDARVVRDRNRVTGGGVTAGIDFGLTLAAEFRDREYAQALQLLAEYDPQPPFDAGSPAKAPAKVRQDMETMMAGWLKQVADVAPTTPGGRK